MTSGPAAFPGLTISGGANTSTAVVDIPKCGRQEHAASDARAHRHESKRRGASAAQTGRMIARWKFMLDAAADGHAATLLSGSIPAIELYHEGREAGLS